jgi:hypothetical protein
MYNDVFFQLKAIKPTWGSGASFTLKKNVNGNLKGNIFMDHQHCEHLVY